MGDFLLEMLVTAVVVFLAERFMPRVEVKSFGTALLVALLIGLLNPTIGWVLRGIFYIGSLGILYLLSFITRLIVLAIIIKIVDWLVGGFRVRGFLTAFILAILLAVAGTLADWIF